MPRIRGVVPGHLTVALVSGCLLLAARSAPAQDVTEASLRATLILNFARFTSWPADVLPDKVPLKACVLSDQAFADVLGRYVKDRPVDGHTIVVSRVEAGDSTLRTCHLLYLAGVNAKQAASVVAGLNGAPVLTLSDVDTFAKVGGVAQLYVEGGTSHFRVNVGTAKRTRLDISSRLLSLADIVKDEPPTPR